MLRSYRPFLVFLLIFLCAACGPNRNNFFNRRYQNLIARDNPYFNAREKLKEAVKTLMASHIDDHSKVLDVYPYAGEKEAKPLVPVMDEVYKKASNVIQRRPISNWIDDSYMLIGRAHFFKRDYFAALETFQYVSGKYKVKNRVISKEAEVWIVKCYLYMDKLGEAEAVVSQLLAEKDFPKEMAPFLHATAAAVYIRQEKYTSALPRMKIAVEQAKGRHQKIRYNYILAQLYERSGQTGLAMFHYRQVIRRTPTYEFEFNAKLSIARLYNPKNKGDAKQVRRYFKKLLRDDKNIDYFDQIYYEMGNLEYRERKIDEAIKFYQLSVISSKSNQKQKALSYYALAKLYFARPDYEMAQAYYDTLSTTMPADFPDYRKIIDTRSVLSELITNLTVIRTEDSLQAMARLSPAELERKVNQLLEKEKQRKVAEAKNKKLKDQQQKNAPPPVNTNPNPGGIGSWYFYNPASVGQGKTDFTRKWGDRKLEDNWRISNKEKEMDFDETSPGDSAEKKVEEKKEEKEEDLLANVPLDKKKYYENLPTSSTAIKESNRRIMDAMYNLGILYEEKLNDDKEATKTYETILKRFPACPYEPELYYRLYKIYTDADNKTEADKYKNLLIDKYPNSDYAFIVQGKTRVQADNNVDKELEAYYRQTYYDYKEYKCDTVISRAIEADRIFPGSVLKPKFDLLRVFCIGRSVTHDSLKVLLQGIVETYPNTDVAKRAQEVITAMKDLAERLKQDSLRALMPKDAPERKSKDYEFSGVDEKHFYVSVIPIGAVGMGDLKVKVSDYNAEFHQLENLQVSALLLDDRNQLFVVKEFPNDKKALVYLKEYEETNKIYQVMGITEYQHFIISSVNFVKLLRSKNLQEYLDIYKDKFK